jgi:hypothetical protein
MLRSLSGRCLGVIFVVCVLMLFFFPLAQAQGPFQATHGPTTAFRAKWAALVLLFSIVAGAFRFSGALVRPWLARGFAWIQEASIHDLNVLKQSATLRC